MKSLVKPRVILPKMISFESGVFHEKLESGSLMKRLVEPTGSLPRRFLQGGLS